MKVSGPNSVRNSSSTKKKKSASGAEGDFASLLGAGEKPKAAGMGTVAAPSTIIGAMLSVQYDEGQSQTPVERGTKLLDDLDALRMGLLLGQIPENVVRQLKQDIDAHAEDITDPKLKEILNEIDVRASVELAKLERSKALAT